MNILTMALTELIITIIIYFILFRGISIRIIDKLLQIDEIKRNKDLSVLKKGDDSRLLRKHDNMKNLVEDGKVKAKLFQILYLFMTIFALPISIVFILYPIDIITNLEIKEYVMSISNEEALIYSTILGCIIYYITALRWLETANKTIDMLNTYKERTPQ